MSTAFDAWHAHHSGAFGVAVVAGAFNLFAGIRLVVALANNADLLRGDE